MDDKSNENPSFMSFMLFMVRFRPVSLAKIAKDAKKSWALSSLAPFACLCVPHADRRHCVRKS